MKINIGFCFVLIIVGALLALVFVGTDRQFHHPYDGIDLTATITPTPTTDAVLGDLATMSVQDQTYSTHLHIWLSALATMDKAVVASRQSLPTDENASIIFFYAQNDYKNYKIIPVAYLYLTEQIGTLFDTMQAVMSAEASNDDVQFMKYRQQLALNAAAVQRLVKLDQ